MKISELKPRINADVTFKVIEKKETRMTGSGKKVAEAVVGDESGVVTMTLWEDDIEKVNVNESYTLKNGYVNLYRGSLRLTVGRTGEIEKSDEEIEEVNTENDMSEKTYQTYRSQSYRSFRDRRPRERRF